MNEDVPSPDTSRSNLPTRRDRELVPLPQFPKRSAEDHKGSFGKALLVGGSRGMSGSITLSGMAALRGGAGLVFLAVPDPILEVVAAAEPSYLTVPLIADVHGKISSDARTQLMEQCQAADAVGIGPGLGQSAGLTALVHWVYNRHEGPLVLDADALNALASQTDCLENPGGPRVLTPHPGEFSRLMGSNSQTIQANRLEIARQFAKRYGVVLVLKGHQTVISDGERTVLNRTGNAGMATGGTGDVLTGLITALIAQGLPPFEAAQLGAYVHGLAGDLAAAELGPISLIASDLIRFLPAAIRHGALAGRSE
ncbi:Bifunctional NAD(P)H-hydrate repair enzyme [Planctomycetales bacterium 10988]|nr:Bifunctional NAD(P)H-hydrate repair enzyme [Planctomycetales bacterium 10988]